MRVIKIILLVIIGSTSLQSQEEYINSSIPNWVNSIQSVDEKIKDDNGGYQYLLIDRQVNLIQKTSFRHNAIKIINATGIQSMSDIELSYDPTYEKIEIHSLQIIRGKSRIDKLKDTELQVIQRESDMERSLYDGSISIVINLADVREGDIIEYSYSTIGFNPVNEGNYARNFYHNFSIPINRIYDRVLVSEGDNFNYKVYNNDEEPLIKKSGVNVEYIWDIEAFDIVLWDDNVPSWYLPSKRVSISTYTNWAQVVDWAIPLYEYNDLGINEMASLISTNEKIEDRIVDYIRFVQDDIRYLGFESGIGAYKPHSPKKVFDQKYGDCKDKSLLLVSLLKNENIESYPFLVNTDLKGELDEEIAKNNAFNHCIVYIEYNDEVFFIDPTISNQGGNLEDTYFPAYERGLLLKSGEHSLFEIPKSTPAELTIEENIYVKEIGGEAIMDVISTYTGSKSDYLRSYFQSNLRENIQKEYLDYYSNLYPYIELDGDIEIVDADRNGSNILITKEHYKIPKFWEAGEDTAYQFCSVYPLVLESEIGYAKTANRSMPYYVNNPHRFKQITKVHMPEDFDLEEQNISISGSVFAYNSSLIGEGDLVTVTHSYEVKDSFIAKDSVEVFLAQHDEIMDSLNTYLSYDERFLGFEFSWVSALIALLALVIGVYSAYKIYYKLNPEVEMLGQDTPIGGWLVLPAIGICIAPVLIIYQLYDYDFFNQNVWLSYYESGVEGSLKFMLVYGIELFYNVLYLVFTVLLLILFFKKRSSVPHLFIIYYILGFLVPVFDLFLVSELPTELIETEDNAELYKDISRSIISAAIWIPYFKISTRVKETFINRI